MSTAPAAERTVSSLAKQLGVSPSRVHYAAKTRGIRPLALAGNCRIFDAAGAAKIAEAVRAIESRRAREA